MDYTMKQDFYLIFKISALFIGGAALLYFALQHFGFLPAFDGSSLDEKFQTLVSAVGRQLGNFRAFVEGHLPSSAAATAGVFSGWKKN